MDKFVVRGGNPLLGTIKVSGAKNSALPCMAAAILTEDEVILENIPQVRDIETERKLLTSMGAEVELGYGRAQHRTRIKCGILSDPVAKYEIVKTMRASSLVLGPLIARTGIARVAMPGGCAIGGRPIDLHINGLEAMGATITQDHGYLEARSPNDGKGRLKGAHIVFDKITVTGTEDLLMAAALAEGESIFENCAREPEVTDLAALLTAMGAKIEGAGTGTIRIQGVAKLHGARHRINPDRIEAGTFLIAGAITGGDLNVDCCEPKHLGALIAKLEQCGVKIDVGADKVRVRSGGELKAADITTEEYPGFPTDMQAQYMALATQAEGTSTVTENIFASCTCRNSSAWARTSPSPAAPLPSEARARFNQPQSCVPTFAPPRHWFSPHSSPTAKPSSTASTTSTAATSTSKKSFAASAPRSAAWETSSAKSNPCRYKACRSLPYTNASNPASP
jgi:UDP-N-acetylglucosamine 1-carboxyvinyltransferase